MSEAEFRLTRDEEKSLLRLARHVLERHVREGVRRFPKASLGDFLGSDRLEKPCGVFVTYHRSGRLRGCIGNIVPSGPLFQAVVENAMHSASDDPRFPPVAPAELENIHIEISVMSPLIKVGNSDEIQVGRDGLILRVGQHSGVFLPQVPVEWKWDRQQYLEELGGKAGLGPDAYRHPKAELWRFTAQVFSESPIPS